MNIGQVYHWLSIACYVLSALAFAVTVYLFVNYKILDVINILSGRKLRQDMGRLSHLSGAASEASDGDLNGRRKKKRPRNKKQKMREPVYGLNSGTEPGKYDTEDWSEGSNNASKRDVYQTEATEELYQTETTEELAQAINDTEEVDIVITGASDTELL